MGQIVTLQFNISKGNKPNARAPTTTYDDNARDERTTTRSAAASPLLSQRTGMGSEHQRAPDLLYKQRKAAHHQLLTSMPLTEATGNQAVLAANTTTTTSSSQMPRPSFPSSRRDSNILGSRASLASTKSTKSHSLGQTTQLSSTSSSSPPYVGTDQDDDDGQDENSQRSSNQVGGGSSKKDAARPHYKEGIRLAEMGKWGTLVVRLQKEPQLARHKDHHGMLPLHWACTEDDVPSSVIQALLKASPEAVLTKNNAQYLPLHIAVRARVGQETLRLLCQARPSSLMEGTPSGKTALMLAQEVNLPAESMKVLRKAEQEYLDMTEDRESSSNDYEDAKRDIAVQSQRLRESMMKPPPQQPAPLQPQQQQPQQQQQQQRSFSAGGPRNTTTVSTTSSGTTFITIANGNGAAPAAGFGMPPGNINNNNRQSAASGFRASNTLNDTGGFRGSNNSSDYYGEQLQSFEPQFQPNTAPSRLTGHMDDLDAEYRRPSRAQQQQHHSHHEHPLTTSLYENEGNSAVCGVCYKKFSMFRKKYQCKGCAVYLCKKHVAGKVMFPTYPKKRSACGDCYRIYRSDPMPLIGTAPAASGRTPSFTSSTTTGTTVVTARNPSDPLDRNSSLRNTTSSVSSSIQQNRPSRATSSQSLVGRPSTIAGPQANLRYSVNAGPSRPRMGNASLFSARTSSTVDRFGSETTVSLSESDPNTSAEIVALQGRITGLEDQNKTLLTRLVDQEKQYNEAMLLLTETMTRVAELEIKLPSMGLKHTFGTSTTSENRESNILGDYDFDFPTPFNEKFD